MPDTPIKPPRGVVMASIENPTELKVEHLLHGVKQLSPVELDEFTQKFTEWQQQREAAIGKDVDPNASDAEVLASIRANLLLPKKENQRYWQLRHKSDSETLGDDELLEYQELVRRLTVLNTKRLKGIAVLVHRWEKSAEEIIAEFGLKAGNDVL